MQEPAAGVLHVNVDPEILTLVREAEWMRRLGLDIPESAGVLTYLRTKLKRDHDHLRVSIRSGSGHSL